MTASRKKPSSASTHARRPRRQVRSLRDLSVVVAAGPAAPHTGAVATERPRTDPIDPLLESLRNPHPDARAWAERGLADWAASLPGEPPGWFDPGAGVPVRWVEGRGWIEGEDGE